MASQARDETVVHLEKVAEERVWGRDRSIWDVHTDKQRWWVITDPTNLYAQSQFPSMDIAPTFHIGLMARLDERAHTSPPWEAYLDNFADAWRKVDDPGEALKSAKEAVDFQAPASAWT